MAEGARLESVYTLIRIEGSNPSLSANAKKGANGSFFIVKIKQLSRLGCGFN